MFTVYILYSKQINRYYIGYTCVAIDERLRRHLTDHKGYTGRANDWIIRTLIPVSSKSEAIRLEMKIKKRGAKRFLLDLDEASG